tara:strand:+ start:1507 stop:3420 length:1914 start_codon:yes stop_codon:yes gene_type:complete
MASSLRNKADVISLEKDNVVRLPLIEVSPENIAPAKRSSLRGADEPINLNANDNQPRTIYSTIYDAKNYAGETAGNIIPSAGQYVKDVVTPFLHPVDTYNGVKSMVVGFKELRDREKYIKANPKKTKPPLTKNMVMAEAVNKHFAERYGDWVGNETDDWSTIGNKFAETFKNDPVGVMGDVSGILSLGTIGMAKYAGKTGQIAQKIAKYSDPIAGTGALTGRAGLALGSIGSGKSIDSLKEAYRAAASDNAFYPFKSSSNKAFKKAQRGKISELDVLKNLSDQTKLYRSELSDSYGSWVNKLPDTPDSNLKSFDALVEEINKVKYKGNKPLYKQKVENVTVPSPSGLLDVSGKPILSNATKTTNIKKVDNPGINDLDKVENLINPYLDNVELQTPKSLAQLKTELSALPLQTNKFNNFKKNVNTSIKADLVRINPNTTKIMDNYGKMSNDLKTLDNIISGGIVSKPVTSGRINNMFPKTNYPVALRKANDILGDLQKNTLTDEITAPILKKIGSDLKPSLAGLDLQDVFSPNTGKLLTGMAATKLGSELTQGSPLAGMVDSLLAYEAAAIPFTSPRIVGNTSNLLGVGNRFGLGTSTGGRGISLLGNPLASSTVRPYPLSDTDNNAIYNSLFNNKLY